MGLVVTGISQDGDTAALEAALKAAGLPLDPIQLIGPDDSTQGAASQAGIVNPGIMTGGDQGNAQFNCFCQTGFETDIRRLDVCFIRHQQNLIKAQCFMNNGISFHGISPCTFKTILSAEPKRHNIHFR